ncbi:uncharacterized protein J3R85_000639 [Psidium guajava]|nr:uncharacterized protein J3R85_000639 [Psidium guajava]
MKSRGVKCLWMILLMVLAMGLIFLPAAEARVLVPRKLQSLVKAEGTSFRFHVLPKGSVVPPSGPSHRTSSYPPPPPIFVD